MIETICPNCRQRYPLGHDHVCCKFPAQDKRRSEGGPRTKPKPVGQAGPPANPRAKTTRGKAGQAKRAKPDRVASRPSGPGGEAARGDGDKASMPALAPPTSKRKDTRKGDRHRAGYWSTYQRKDRKRDG